MGLSELLANICFCCCSFFHFIFIISQWKCKLKQPTVYFQLLDISACHSFSEWKLLTCDRTQWLQHCSQLIIFPISSRLSRITHLFIIINHLNPSAGFDNYHRLAELRTWPDMSNTGSQALYELTCLLGREPCFVLFFSQAVVYCRHYTLMLSRAGRVSKSRWSFGRDTEEEVWVYISPVDGISKPQSTVQVNHWRWTLSFCTLQASKDLGKKIVYELHFPHFKLQNAYAGCCIYHNLTHVAALQ